MNYTFYAFLLNALMPCGLGVLVAQQDAKSRMMQDAPLDLLRDSVRFREGMLVRELELQSKGVSSEISVEYARIRLAKERHDLANQEKRYEAAIEQTRFILELRAKQEKRVLQLRENGLASEYELIEAQRHLACARYFLAMEERNVQAVTEQLERIVDLCKKEHRYLEKLRTQSVSSWEVNRAENRLVAAQYLLSKTVSGTEEVTKQLRRQVEIHEKEWKEVQDLKRTGAAMIYEVYGTRLNLLNAKLRLANVENNPEAMAEQLRALIKLHDETLPRFKGMNNPDFEQHLKDWVKSELGRDKLRLAKLQAGNPHVDDLASAEIDT